MAEKYGSKIEMQPIKVEHYEPQDKDAFLRFHGLESDRLAGSHERKGAPSYTGIKREAYKQAAEMMGFGTTNVVAGNYFPNYRPVVKIPVIMTGAASAIRAHYDGYPKEGDIIKDREHEFVLGLAPTTSAISPDASKSPRTRHRAGVHGLNVEDETIPMATAEIGKGKITFHDFSGAVYE